MFDNQWGNFTFNNIKLGNLLSHILLLMPQPPPPPTTYMPTWTTLWPNSGPIAAVSTALLGLTRLFEILWWSLDGTNFITPLEISKEKMTRWTIPLPESPIYLTGSSFTTPATIYHQKRFGTCYIYHQYISMSWLPCYTTSALPRLLNNSLQEVHKCLKPAEKVLQLDTHISRLPRHWRPHPIPLYIYLMHAHQHSIFRKRLNKEYLSQAIPLVH